MPIAEFPDFFGRTSDAEAARQVPEHRFKGQHRVCVSLSRQKRDIVSTTWLRIPADGSLNNEAKDGLGELVDIELKSKVS